MVDNALCYQNGSPGMQFAGNNLNDQTRNWKSGTDRILLHYIVLVYMVIPQSPANATATPSAVCSGQNVQLDEIAGNAVSWSWSGPGGFTSNIQNPVVNNVTIANAGTYTVTITDANGCTSTDQVDITISPAPTASLAGTLVFCPGDCHQINTQIQGGTEPYEANFTIQVGPFNIPFSVPGYNVNNQLTICYSGTSPFPGYDNATNTLTIPSWMTGTGTLILNDIISADGCSASLIDPDNLTLTFKEKNDITTAGPIQECDYDFDGLGIFDLTSLDVTIIDGQDDVSVLWFEDGACTIPISNPGSFSTGTTYSVCLCGAQQ